MKLQVVLNGGLKSCCSTYPPDAVLRTVEAWVAGTCEVTVIDAKQATWSADEPATAAIRYFGESAFPFVYVDDRLMAAGALPPKEQILAMLSDQHLAGISTDDVIGAAKRAGRYDSEPAARASE